MPRSRGRTGAGTAESCPVDGVYGADSLSHLLVARHGLPSVVEALPPSRRSFCDDVQGRGNCPKRKPPRWVTRPSCVEPCGSTGQAGGTVTNRPCPAVDCPEQECAGWAAAPAPSSATDQGMASFGVGGRPRRHDRRAGVGEHVQGGSTWVPAVLEVPAGEPVYGRLLAVRPGGVRVVWRWVLTFELCRGFTVGGATTYRISQLAERLGIRPQRCASTRPLDYCCRADGVRRSRERRSRRFLPRAGSRRGLSRSGQRRGRRRCRRR